MAEALNSVRVVRRFDVPPERLFDAWLDPDEVGTWLFATPERRDGEEWEHRGEYLVVDRPLRLKFSFVDPVFAKTTYVTVEIAAQGDGSEITLTHDGVLPEWVAPTTKGWGMILDGLARAME